METPSSWHGSTHHLSVSTLHSSRPLSAPSSPPVGFWADTRLALMSTRSDRTADRDTPGRREGVRDANTDRMSLRRLRIPKKRSQLERRPQPGRSASQDSVEEVPYDISTLCPPPMTPTPPSPIFLRSQSSPPTTLTWAPQHGGWIRNPSPLEWEPNPLISTNPSHLPQPFEHDPPASSSLADEEGQADAPPSYLESQLEEARRRGQGTNHRDDPRR